MTQTGRVRKILGKSADFRNGLALVAAIDAPQDLVVKGICPEEGRSRATVSRGLGGSRHPGREEANRPAP
jgi:hypothetical protein